MTKEKKVNVYNEMVKIAKRYRGIDLYYVYFFDTYMAVTDGHICIHKNHNIKLEEEIAIDIKEIKDLEKISQIEGGKIYYYDGSTSLYSEVDPKIIRNMKDAQERVLTYINNYFDPLLQKSLIASEQLSNLIKMAGHGIEIKPFAKCLISGNVHIGYYFKRDDIVGMCGIA